MNFYELAKKRCSVRTFKPEHLTQKDLDYILACGRIAPSAVNYQPWRILVLNNDESCAKLQACNASQSHAPAALLVCYDKTSCWIRRYDGYSSGEADASIAVTHTMLAAAEIGVGSVWVGAFDPDKTRQVLNVPDNLEPVAFLMLGYPADDMTPAPMHDDRLPAEETVFYDQF